MELFCCLSICYYSLYILLTKWANPVRQFLFWKDCGRGVWGFFWGESNPLRVMRCDSGESVLERGRVLIGEPEDLVGQGLYKKAERSAEALYSSSSSRFGICYGFLSWEVEVPAGQLEWESQRCFLERWELPPKAFFIRHKDQLLKLGLYFPFFFS